MLEQILSVTKLVFMFLAIKLQKFAVMGKFDGNWQTNVHLQNKLCIWFWLFASFSNLNIQKAPMEGKIQSLTLENSFCKMGKKKCPV